MFASGFLSYERLVGIFVSACLCLTLKQGGINFSSSCFSEAAAVKAGDSVKIFVLREFLSASQACKVSFQCNRPVFAAAELRRVSKFRIVLLFIEPMILYSCCITDTQLRISFEAKTCSLPGSFMKSKQLL